jgi:hypothetical protein
MNTSIKQTWSRDDTILVTRCYLEGKTLQETQALMPDIKLPSLKTKLANCLYLDKKDSKSRFVVKNVSKLHQDVWDELKGALTVPDVEAASVPEDDCDGKGYWDDHEEDGEEYFMCTGTCNRVCHYEDTDGEGMCGKCQYESQKKGKSRRK